MLNVQGESVPNKRVGQKNRNLLKSIFGSILAKAAYKITSETGLILGIDFDCRVISTIFWPFWPFFKTFGHVLENVQGKKLLNKRAGMQNVYELGKRAGWKMSMQGGKILKKR